MPEKIYKTTFSLFSESPKFEVPIYQREYKWGPQQIDEFITDIEGITLTHNGDEIVPDFNHFLGLLVFIDGTNEESERVYHLIDGQQRISTITLIASVANDIISKALQDPDIVRSESGKLEQIKSLFKGYIYLHAHLVLSHLGCDQTMLTENFLKY